MCEVTRTFDPQVHGFFSAAPGGVRMTQALLQDKRVAVLDMGREHGLIRLKEHMFGQDGGLAVRIGNLADERCIVKTAGVDVAVLKFSGSAQVLEAQDDAVIGLVEQSDLIEISMSNRWAPAKARPRKVSTVLPAYAALTTSAAMGAVRYLPKGM